MSDVWGSWGVVVRDWNQTRLALCGQPDFRSWWRTKSHLKLGSNIFMDNTVEKRKKNWSSRFCLKLKLLGVQQEAKVSKSKNVIGCWQNPHWNGQQAKIECASSAYSKAIHHILSPHIYHPFSNWDHRSDKPWIWPNICFLIRKMRLAVVLSTLRARGRQTWKRTPNMFLPHLLIVSLPVCVGLLGCCGRLTGAASFLVHVPVNS